MINTKLQSIIDTKSAIGNAIVNKGGTITGATPFYNYAAQIDGLTSGSTIDGYDESKLSFYKESDNYGNRIQAIAINNGFIYAGGQDTNTVQKFYESNLAFVNNTASYGGDIQAIAINNGFIYAAGVTANVVSKYNETTLALVGNTATYGGQIRTLAINNGVIYAGGTNGTNATTAVNSRVQSFFESNLARRSNSSTVYGGNILTIAINNSFVYAGGGTNNSIHRFHETNLVFNNSSTTYGTTISNIAINNGIIYVAGSNETASVVKYIESNMAKSGGVGNVFVFDATASALTFDNGYIYVTGSSTFGVNRSVSKLYESNLVVVGNSPEAGLVGSIVVNNGFVYVGGPNRISKYYTATPFTNNVDNNAWYLIPKE